MIEFPEAKFDAALELLRKRGATHERAYVEPLRSKGLTICEVAADAPSDARVAATADALSSGVDVIYQGAFAGSRWIAYADILRRTACGEGQNFKPGDFHYEPYDTKLARETRGGTILQLALYAELLANQQGVLPTSFHVVSPGGPFTIQKYRLFRLRRVLQVY